MNITQIKIFGAETTAELEKEVNKYLATLDNKKAKCVDINFWNAKYDGGCAYYAGVKMEVSK